MGRDYLHRSFGPGNQTGGRSFLVAQRLILKWARYQPQRFLESLNAVKKLSQEARVSKDVAKLWLMKQAIRQIYLPAPKNIQRPKFDVSSPNSVYQADLFF